MLFWSIHLVWLMLSIFTFVQIWIESKCWITSEINNLSSSFKIKTFAREIFSDISLGFSQFELGGSQAEGMEYIFLFFLKYLKAWCHCTTFPLPASHSFRFWAISCLVRTRSHTSKPVILILVSPTSSDPPPWSSPLCRLIADKMFFPSK